MLHTVFSNSTSYNSSSVPTGNISIFSNSAPGNLGIGATNGAYTYSVTSPGIWQNSTSQGSIQIKGDAEFEGRVRINGQDLVDTLEAIQRRLCILVPDKKLLDKYEALQQAYDHYKTLEALCIDENSTSRR